MLFFVSFNFSSNKFKFILYLFSINLGESKLHKRHVIKETIKSVDLCSS
jgi:hypothetical protein